MTSYLQPYNPQWPKRYQQEIKHIKEISNIDLELFHIGSTVITNLWAKNCIDILGVIKDFPEGIKVIKPLESVGYEYRGEYGINGRHYFAKTQPNKFHLHIFSQGAEAISKHLHYVNVMNKHPKLVVEFNAFKQQLLKIYPKDKSMYQLGKAQFYDKISKFVI